MGMRCGMRCVLGLVLALSTLIGVGRSDTRTVAVEAAGLWTGPIYSAGLAPWDTTVAGVNMANGNLMVAGGGLGIPGVNGLDEVVVPIYNSDLMGTATDLGYGWHMGTGRDVGLDLSSSTSVVYHSPTGHLYTFAVNGSTYTAPAGLDAQLVKNGDGTYTLTENASGAEEQFSANGYLTAAQNREGNQIGFAYDGSGNLTQVTNTEGQVTTVAHDGQNRVTSVTDAASRTWTYGYDSGGNLDQITDPAGHATTFIYDSYHRIIQSTDPDGNATLITYYPCGDLNPCPLLQSPAVSKIVRVTNPSNNTGPTWSFSCHSLVKGYGSYDLSNCPRSPNGYVLASDPNGHTTTYTLDSTGRVIQVGYPDGTASNLTWTSDNQVASAQSPSGATTTYSYDSLNNLTQTTLPNGVTLSQQYADTNHPYLPTSATDAQGNATSYQYTSGGLLSQTTDAGNHTATFSYNANGTLASSTDENGHVTTHSYTSAGLPQQYTPPAPKGTTAYSFNGYDLEASITDGNGKVTSFAYDVLGRLTGIGYADGSSIGYSYDADGNVLSMADSTGPTSYTYDALSELTKKTLPNGQTVTYTYDYAGNLLSKTDSGGTVSYGYNAVDQVTSVTDRQNRLYTVGYDADGNRTSIGFSNGVTESMTYNTAGQLTEIKGTTGSSTLTDYKYGYTNPTTNQSALLPYSVTDTSGNTTSYTYDNGNQLTQAIQKNSGGNQIASYGYGYDPAGNLTSKTVNGTSATFSYNAAGELTSASGGMSMTYSYDGNGDRTSSLDGTKIALNPADQITSITPPGGSAIAMTYTGTGEQQRVGAGSTRYQYDGTGVSKQTDTMGDTYFTSLPDGTLLSETVPSGSYAGTYSYLSDGSGSVAAVTDTSGAVKNLYSYNPLGNATSSGSVPNPFTFQGGMYDSSTHYYYTGHDYYDPATGQSFGCKDTRANEDACGEDEPFTDHCMED